MFCEMEICFELCKTGLHLSATIVSSFLQNSLVFSLRWASKYLKEVKNDQGGVRSENEHLAVLRVLSLTQFVTSQGAGTVYKCTSVLKNGTSWRFL